ncbi:kinase-like domain-containing protein [Mycena pura]|uniref:Kinase-like domain-containing protein n=1 Tax=Mycena pura TaxID=153505 RepID=A0AAD6UXH5_9AGAR|nr:kinase-like domain-containing protein [Mycena pura]
MIPAVHIKESEPDLLCNERIVYSLLGPHPRIAEIKNTNLYTLPVETRIEKARTEPLCIAFAPNGDLQQYLLNHPDIPQRLRAKWGVQIAEGLAFIHSRHIVWADCTPANMLLTADLDILLCDFGGSGIRGSETGVSPPRIYCDPELDSSRNFSGERRIDIYAFGCVFLEILTYNADFLSPTPPDVRRGGMQCPCFAFSLWCIDMSID